MKRISWMVTVPVTLVAIVFAIANRAPTEINLWPLPWRATLPLYLVIVGTSRFEPVYRVLSFLALGTVLLVVSLLFTRLRKRKQAGSAERPVGPTSA